MTDLTKLTLAAARKGLADKSFSSTELTGAYLTAIEAANPKLNAYVAVTADQAQDMAKAADARLATGQGGPLEGIPLGIKDLFGTKGVHTQAASHILDGFKPEYESTVTSNLWRDGAVMLGKLNMDEFAMGSSNETSYYGPVVNPWRSKGSNAQLVPGGSSGGSAAAVTGLALRGRHGHRHRRLDPPAGCLHRHCRYQADLRPLLALGRRGVCLFARPGRADRAHCRGCGDHARLHVRIRRQGFDQRRACGAGLRRCRRARA